MASSALLIMVTTMKAITPNKYAFLILATSLGASLLMFKMSLTSWPSLILIMLFSSGMMTLFIYVSSLAPNEKSKSNPTLILAPMLLLGLTPSKTTLSQSKPSMKSFSQQTLLIMMTMILILTMLTISLQSFNPQQSMSSTF